jgi:anti-sigma factor RsiW
MNCAPFDLRDYCLHELSTAERQQVEAHVKGCGSCREELDRLRLTEASLLTLREEEIPQRIAFVSDKIFEPSPWRRAWQAFWGSGARLGFASAAMLSAALIVFSLARTAGSPAAPLTVGVSSATVSNTQLQQQVQQLEQRVAELARQTQEQDQTLKRAADQFDYLERLNSSIVRASYVQRPVTGDFK